ncbi:related to Putative protease AXL1 [Zygosaccharomyces bailii]|nr:related to Putative protease AXL1 [Zygosaccharomyces bailii]
MSVKHLKYYDVPFLTPFSFEGRAHKLCKLPNGILTLLISDPTENSSACSLTVATGSHNDPIEVPGLAHLCEHMVLAAGSRKYPDPGLYHEKILKNGGSQNAFTTGEQTTFYFQLPNIYHSLERGFEEALDIFGSFFEEPLFNSTIINKETYAIESEHGLNTSTNSKIFYHGVRLLANENHPFNRFSTGNISTLSSIPHLKGLNLKSQLHEYFKENYCATKMTLCLRGPQSIHSLARLAANNFSQIRMHPSQGRFSPPRSPTKWRKSPCEEQKDVRLEKMRILRGTWLPKYHGNLCFMPDQEQKVLFIKSSKNPVVRFVFPAVEKSTRFTSKDLKLMTHFWPELLGDDSHGSFSHWLTKRNWITCCYAFVSEIATGNSSLILELDLTKSGFQNIPYIVKILLKQIVPAFSQKFTLELARFLSEQNCIDLIRFLYQSAEISPMEECAKLSCLLQDDLEAIDPACIFRGFPMLIDIKNQTIGNYGENKESDTWWIGQAIKFQNFLKQFMTLSNMRMIILGDITESTLGFTHSDLITDVFYEFEYCKRKHVTNPKEELVTDYSFTIPPPNCFIPSWAGSYPHLKNMLIESSAKSQSVPLSCTIQNTAHKAIPHLASQNSNHEMWVLPDEDDVSLHLKCIVSFEIFALDLEASPQSTMNLEILGQIISISLLPQIYPSLKLGFTCELIPSKKGDVRLRFTICGFSEQLITVVKFIIEIIRKISEDPSFPSKETFRRARILVRNNYERAADENCANIGSIGLYIVLEKYMWSLEDRLDALEEIDLFSLKKFCASFIESTKYLSLFVQGDLSCADELNSYLHRNFTQHLGGGIYETCGKNFLIKTTKILEPGTNLCVQHDGQKDDPNNSIVYFIQTGHRNDKDAFTLSSFTAFLLSLTLTKELRTKRQVGYLVTGGLRLLSDSIGLHITIMSSGSPLDLETKIDQYLWYLESQIEKLTEEEFRKEYVRVYLRLLDGNCSGDVNESSGPIDLLSELVANVQMGDSEILASPTMKRHRRLQNQIIQEQYNFSTQGESIDCHLLTNMPLKQYLEFFRTYITVNSTKRSKISIMIACSMAEKEIINRKIFLQLEAFLKVKGFAIPVDDLQKIVERSKGKPKNLALELYSSFHARNEARRLCSVVLAELFKMLAMSLRHRYGNLSRDDTSRKDSQEWNSNVKSALELRVIEDINLFKRVQL